MNKKDLEKMYRQTILEKNIAILALLLVIAVLVSVIILQH